MRVRTRLLYSLAALTMLLLSLNSFRFFISEVHSFQGKRYEQYWESQGEIGDISQWRRARAHMNRALVLNEANAVTWLRAARVYEWYNFTPSPDPLRIREYRVKSGEAMERAVDLRPEHAGGIAARAVLKARHWQVDTSLSEDMAKAFTLAPAQEYVMRRVAKAGLATWPALDESGRSVVKEMFATAIQFQPAFAREMLALASKFGRTDSLCNGVSELDFLLGEHRRYNPCHGAASRGAITP